MRFPNLYAYNISILFKSIKHKILMKIDKKIIFPSVGRQ